MIQSLRIQNLRALRDTRLTLRPLTVLVGPNGAGKSSILRALDPRGLHADDIWRHTSDKAIIELEYRRTGKPVTPYVYDWNPSIQSGNWAAARPYTFQLLRLDLQALRAPNQLAAQHSLDTSGNGAANLFYTLGRTKQAEFADRFCRLVPIFSDLDLTPTTGGNHEFKFQDRWNKNVSYRPHEVSDGTMMLLAFELIEYQTPAPTLIAIEEPERGLHPYLMGELVKTLRRLTSSGKQVLLCTHSPSLLDCVEPEEVRFLTRNETDGSVRVEEVSQGTEGWQAAWEAHLKSLGSVWLAGSVGGVPGA